jgi:hypothetical protein
MGYGCGGATMTGLLDIAEERANVILGGQEIEVHGLTMEDVAKLLRRFPELRQLFGGGEEAMADALNAIPGLMVAVIAGGLGHLGDEEHEAKARSLPAWMQNRLWGAVLKLTMPDGIGPFVEELGTAFGVNPTLVNGSLLQSRN